MWTQNKIHITFLTFLQQKVTTGGTVWTGVELDRVLPRALPAGLGKGQHLPMDAGLCWGSEGKSGAGRWARYPSPPPFPLLPPGAPRPALSWLLPARGHPLAAVSPWVPALPPSAGSRNSAHNPARAWCPRGRGGAVGAAPSSLACAPSALPPSPSPTSLLSSTLAPCPPPSLSSLPSSLAGAPFPRSPSCLLLPYSFPPGFLQIPSAPPPTLLPCAPPSSLPPSVPHLPIPPCPSFPPPRPSSLRFPTPLPGTLPSSTPSPPGSRSSHVVAMEPPAAARRLAGAALWPWGLCSDSAWGASASPPRGPGTKPALPHLGSALWDLHGPPGGALRPPGICLTLTSVGRTPRVGVTTASTELPSWPPKITPASHYPHPHPRGVTRAGGWPDGPISTGLPPFVGSRSNIQANLHRKMGFVSPIQYSAPTAGGSVILWGPHSVVFKVALCVRMCECE